MNEHETMDELLRLLSSGEIDEDQQRQLEQLIQKSPEARKQYVDYVEVDALLNWRYGEARPFEAAPESFGLSLPNDSGATPFKWALAAGLLIAVGLTILFAVFNKDPVEIADAPDPVPVPIPELPVQIASRYSEATRLSGWVFFASTDAVHEVTGEAEVRLDRGELYAASMPEVENRPHLHILTPAGQVTAKGTRFHITTRKDTTTMNQTNKIEHFTRVLIMTGVVALSNAFGSAEAAQGEQLQSTSTTSPKKLQQAGNYKEALNIYEKLVVDPAHKGRAAADDLSAARDCMNRLNRIDLWDDLAEKAIASHPEDWQVLYAAAQGYSQSQHWGRFAGGTFSRGWHIRSGRQVNATERDRIRALQLLQQALPHITEDDDPKIVADFYNNFSSILRSGGASWRLQMLTDIDDLPEWDDPAHWGRTSYAPVDENNQPVFYHVPASWDAARNDGERWRWLMKKVVEVDPARKLDLELDFAGFLRGQFGVQQLGSLIQRDEDNNPDGGIYSVHTLKETETLTRLANGVQRLTLPDEFNFVKIYRDVAGVKPPKGTSAIEDLNYAYYEGDWNELPDFNKLKPKNSGTIKSGLFDISVA
ncbi:MAG: hypothetical protein AAF492_12800, partial [Verrucomicrobiota bacterium]